MKQYKIPTRLYRVNLQAYKHPSCETYTPSKAHYTQSCYEGNRYFYAAEKITHCAFEDIPNLWTIDRSFNASHGFATRREAWEEALESLEETLRETQHRLE